MHATNGMPHMHIHTLFHARTLETATTMPDTHSSCSIHYEVLSLKRINMINPGKSLRVKSIKKEFNSKRKTAHLDIQSITTQHGKFSWQGFSRLLKRTQHIIKVSSVKYFLPTKTAQTDPYSTKDKGFLNFLRRAQFSLHIHTMGSLPLMILVCI